MAKATRKNAARKGLKRPKLKRASLIARALPTSTSATIGITFTSGLGQATVSLFRQGLVINMQSVSVSADVHFSDVESGDVISMNGVCTGNARINIDVATSPATPTNFGTGNFNIIYDVI